MTREDIRWRPSLVLLGFVVASFMVVNASSGGSLLTDVQLWGY